jgi:hypothetical protein
MAGLEAPWELMGAYRRGEGEGEEGQGARPRGAARGGGAPMEGGLQGEVPWGLLSSVRDCCFVRKKGRGRRRREGRKREEKEKEGKKYGKFSQLENF